MNALEKHLLKKIATKLAGWSTPDLLALLNDREPNASERAIAEGILASRRAATI